MHLLRWGGIGICHYGLYGWDTFGAETVNELVHRQHAARDIRVAQDVHDFWRGFFRKIKRLGCRAFRFRCATINNPPNSAAFTIASWMSQRHFVMPNYAVI